MSRYQNCPSIWFWNWTFFRAQLVIYNDIYRPSTFFNNAKTIVSPRKRPQLNKQALYTYISIITAFLVIWHNVFYTIQIEICSRIFEASYPIYLKFCSIEFRLQSCTDEQIIIQICYHIIHSNIYNKFLLSTYTASQLCMNIKFCPINRLLDTLD